MRNPERARAGVRRREWQAVAPTELEEVGREMACCLGEIAAGRWTD